jgi:hypothetical protein
MVEFVKCRFITPGNPVHQINVSLQIGHGDGPSSFTALRRDILSL